MECGVAHIVIENFIRKKGLPIMNGFSVAKKRKNPQNAKDAVVIIIIQAIVMQKHTQMVRIFTDD